MSEDPFFSICIPQYARTDFLIVALKSLASQRFRDFEVCVSDDKSPDGRQAEVIEELKKLGVGYKFEVREKNSRYDANLRAAIALARGHYCFLLGNDDALLDENTLARVHKLMRDHGPCGVVIPNFQDYQTGVITHRVRRTGNKGSGPQISAKHFRDFSFVSGVVLARPAAQSLATDKWDGSEMYQTFVGCRIIASGEALLQIAEPLIRKDIRLPGQVVDSYASRPRIEPCPIVERATPLVQLGRLTVDAIRPYVSGAERARQNLLILKQLLIYPYPFWLVEYRRVQSWRYAAGIAIGMRPRRTAQDVELTAIGKLLVKLYYALASGAGLLTPNWLFSKAQPVLYRLAKRAR
jgi:glycosyltransferase involved in cell wall biosynthesis